MSYRADEAVLSERLMIAPGCVLRAAVRMMDAALTRFPLLDSGLQRRQRQPHIDQSDDRIARHLAAPSVEEGGDIGEAGRDRGIDDVPDSELICAIGHDLFR